LQTVHKDFFTQEQKNVHDAKLVQEDMPFLYELISSKLLNGIKSKSEDGKHPDCDSDNADSTAFDNSTEETLFEALNSSTVEPGNKHLKQKDLSKQQKRAYMVSNTAQNYH
jgi:hypothetical protein